MSFENPFVQPASEESIKKIASPKPEKIADDGPEATLEQWVENLSEEQKQVRDSILEGTRNHKTINLGPAFEKLLTSSERELWDRYINSIAFGEGELAPEQIKRFSELSVKLGLKEKEEEPQATVKEGVEEAPAEKTPTFGIDVFQAEGLEDTQALQKMSSSNLPGYSFLFRGVKESWRAPSLSEEKFIEVMEEIDQLVEDMMEHPTPPSDKPELDAPRARRFRELQELIRTEGDQWFSDNPELARHYAGKTGSVVRIAVKSMDIFPYMKETGMTPGGHGTNFLIPREWFAKSESLNLEQLRLKKITSRDEAIALLKDWLIGSEFAHRRAYLFENATGGTQELLETDAEYQRLEQLLRASPDDPEFYSYATAKLAEVLKVITPNIKNLEGKERTTSEEEDYNQLVAIHDKYKQAAHYLNVDVEEG